MRILAYTGSSPLVTYSFEDAEMVLDARLTKMQEAARVGHDGRSDADAPVLPARHGLSPIYVLFPSFRRLFFPFYASGRSQAARQRTYRAISATR